MTLRTQLTLGFTLVTLLGVGITGGLLISTSYKQALQRVRAAQLLLAENRANAITGEVSSEVTRLEHLATLSDLDLTDVDRAPEEAMLRHARSAPRYFTLETSAVGPGGEVQWTEPPSRTSARSVAGEAWFKEARSHHDTFVIDVPGADHAVRSRLVVPLWREGGRFAGCLTSTIDPTAASRWSEKLSVELGKSGTAVLVDRAGKVVTWRGAPEGPSFSERDLAIHQALQGKQASIWGRDAAGQKWLVTAVPLPNTGWALMTRQARAEVDDDLNPEVLSFGLLLLVGLTFALALGVLYSRALAQPITALAQVAREVERGHFEEVPHPSRGGELGDLERAFFSMTATLEAKVRDRTHALEEAQAQLVEAGRFAAMGKTAAAIAHELKNALNGLGVAVDVLTGGKLPPAAQEPIREQVRQEVARLRDITDNLNIFAGTPRLNLAPQDLRGLVERACLLLTDRIRDAEVDLQIDLPESLPPVICDGQKLQGVLINLVKNAVEAVEPEVDDPTASGRIRVSARVVGEALEIEVADSGPGIAGVASEHLFEPFFTTKRTGTGLGLTIGRKVIEAHGGSLTWTSNTPHGTRMQVRLPLEPRLQGVVAPRASA